MNLIQYDQYTIQRKLYFFFTKCCIVGVCPLITKPAFSQFQFFSAGGTNQTTQSDMDRHGQDQGGEQNQNGERHQGTESLLTSGNGLKEENKTYLTFLSWIHSRAISTVEVLGKGFHIFKRALGHVTQ